MLPDADVLCVVRVVASRRASWLHSLLVVRVAHTCFTVLEARGGSFAVFYVSWKLWEAHLYVFYVSWRLREAHL